MYIELIAKKSKLARVVLTLSILAVTTACERELQLKIDGKNPPTFTLYGSGNLIFLYVAEVKDKRPPALDDPELWRIQPTGSNKISELDPVTYGIVPRGFTQITPASGAPPILLEGRTYQVGGPAFNANGGSIWFTIKDGKSVKIPKPEKYP